MSHVWVQRVEGGNRVGLGTKRTCGNGAADTQHGTCAEEVRILAQRATTPSKGFSYFDYPTCVD